MTRRVVLHVGAPKSGTTYLQRVMRHNQEALREQGVLVAGATHTELVHAGFVVREDTRLAGLPPRAAGAWKRIVEAVDAFPGETAIISYELLAGARPEQAARAVAAFPGKEVSVVVTTRDLGRSVSSAWQERLKFALTTPLEEWRPRSESAGPKAEWGWRTMNPASVARRWRGDLPASAVHIVTSGPGRASPTQLWERFAAACGIPDVTIDLEVAVANESLGVVAAELLRRVNAEDLGEIQGAREQSKWLRDLLAHRVLAPLDDEPFSITEAQHEDAAGRAASAREEIAGAGYAVHGDLGELSASRREARLPGEVTDAELLGVATKAIVALLHELRNVENELRNVEDGDGTDGGGPRALVGRLTRREDSEDLERLEVEVSRLAGRVADDRRLHHRVAMLSDLVSELLLPTEVQDPRRLLEGLREYRKDTL